MPAAAPQPAGEAACAEEPGAEGPDELDGEPEPGAAEEASLGPDEGPAAEATAPAAPDEETAAAAQEAATAEPLAPPPTLAEASAAPVEPPAPAVPALLAAAIEPAAPAVPFAAPVEPAAAPFAQPAAPVEPAVAPLAAPVDPAAATFTAPVEPAEAPLAPPAAAERPISQDRPVALEALAAPRALGPGLEIPGAAADAAAPSLLLHIDEDPEPVPASARDAEVSEPQPVAAPRRPAEAPPAPAAAAPAAPPEPRPGPRATAPAPRPAPRRPAAPRARKGQGRSSLRAFAYGAAALLLFGTGLGVSRFVGAGPQRTRGLPAQLESERAALSAAIEDARGARDWPRCIERAERLLQIPESPAYPHRRAREALELAQDEQRNLLGYDRFLQAASRRAPDAAVLTYLELSANSVYRELGAARFLEAREAFVRAHLGRARGELDRLGCRAAQPHLDAILSVDPQSAALPELIALQARCRAGDTVARGERRGGRGAAQVEREPQLMFAPERPAERGERPPSRQLEDAQQAYISGNYRQAIRIAQQHTGSDPLRAWRVIGGAACYLGDEGLIRKTLDHLDDPAQQFVRQVCQRNGITP